MAEFRLRGVIDLDTTAFERAIGTVRARFQRLQQDLQTVGGALTRSLSLPLAGLGAAALAAGGRLDSLERAMVAITGSAAEAQQQLNRLREIARLPGINFEQAVRGSQTLQAVGLSAEQAEKMLREFANAVTLAGGSAEDLGEIVRQVTQIIGLGRLTAENFNVIAERAPVVRQALERAFGTSSLELIQRMNLSIEDFLARLTDGLATLPRASGGLQNAMQNLFNSITTAVGQLGVVLDRSLGLTSVFERLSLAIERAGEAIRRFAEEHPALFRLGSIVAGVAAATGPLLLALGGVARIMPVVAAGARLLGAALSAMSGPVGLAVGGVAALGAGAILAIRNWDALRQAITVSVREIGESLRGLGELALGAMRILAGDATGAASLVQGWERIREAAARAQVAQAGAMAAIVQDVESMARRVVQWLTAPIKSLEAFGAAATNAARRVGEAFRQLDMQRLKPLAPVLLMPEDLRAERQAQIERARRQAFTGATPAERLAGFTRMIGLQGLQPIDPATMQRLQEAIEQASEATSAWQQSVLGIKLAIADIAATVGGVLVDGLLQARSLFQSIKMIAAGIVRDLAAAAAKAAVLSALGLGTGGFFGTLGRIFGGFRAHGGPVAPGRAYVVGERGPELFVPKAAGMIIPHGGFMAIRPGAVIAETRVDLDALIIRLKQRESFRSY